MQNRWFFAISPDTGGSKYFTRKCGGFLELTLLRALTFYGNVYQYCGTIEMTGGAQNVR
jgi:hypothetical protein